MGKCTSSSGSSDADLTALHNQSVHDWNRQQLLQTGRWGPQRAYAVYEPEAGEPRVSEILWIFASALLSSDSDRRRRRLEERDRLLRTTAGEKLPGEDGWDRTLRVEREVVAANPSLGLPLEGLVRLAVLVFARPTGKISKEVIDPSTRYLHLRSGSNIDIVKIGYTPAGFLEEEFVALVSEFEELTSWRYSGDTDVLLFNVRYDPKARIVRPDFSRAVCLTLEKVIRDGTFETASTFFEDLIRFSTSFRGDDPAWGFSDSIAAKEGGNALLQIVLKIMPKEVKVGFDRAKHFAVRDVGRKGKSQPFARWFRID